MSWAAVAGRQSAAPAPVDAPAPTAEERVAVVDTNAIISGLRLENLADRFCTIPEVLAEVRDKQARTFLSTLPFSLDVREPDEESLKAVQRFARETGDIHSLSTVDVKLLALAHTLEVAANGPANLREHPVQVRTRQKHKSRPRQLLGWGTVPNPEDWKVVDEAPEDMLTNATGPGQSRIIAAVQSLTLDGAVEAPPALPPPPPTTTSTAPPAAGSFGAAAVAAAAGAAGAAAAPPALVPPPAQASTSQEQQSSQQQPQAVQAQAQGEAAASGHGEEDEEEEEDEEDDDDGWCTAAKSRNAARRKSRKERRHAAWLEAQQQQQPKQQQPQQGAASPATAAAAASAPAAAEGAEGESEGEDEEEEMEEHEGVELVTDDGEDEGEEGEEGAPSESGTAATTAATTTAAGGLEVVDELLPNTTSNVFMVTADFAMQNVMLQMGLRLVTRDGKQITRVSRWALRCSACYFVTKEAGRLFCPRCGNMTMDKVEVTVGPGGAEFFGVRKKFILRGTRYSLPKPKGGRLAVRNPILREDVLLARQAGYRRGNNKPQAAGELDPFAPEYGTETWHQAGGGRGGGKGLPRQLHLTSWKNNPNEVKAQRKSRRK